MAEGTSDSVPATTGTDAIIKAGKTVTGAVNTPGDHDWYRVTLAAGTQYRVALDGDGPTPLGDPALGVRDGTGALLADDDEDGPGKAAALTFTPTRSGTYFLDAGAFAEAASGGYRLAIAPLKSLSPDGIADFLVAGYWQYDGSEPHHFAGDSVTYTVRGLTAPAQALARAALALWQDVIDLTFVEIAGGAQITLDDAESGAFTSVQTVGTATTAAQVNIGRDWLAAYGSTTDSYSFQTYLHELGHALGLGHAGPYNGGAVYGVDNAYLNDSWGYTVMSYFEQPNYGGASERTVVTPQLADLIAGARLYGAATETRSGDTVYGFHGSAGPLFDFATYGVAPALTLYDSGGTDILDCSGYGAAQRISLVPGSFSDIGGLIGNIAVGRGVTVETALGGSGNDTLIGNDAANKLDGGAGKDSMRGGPGNDTYIVTQAGDRAVERADQGADTVRSAIGVTLGDHVEKLVLTGRADSNGNGNGLANSLTGNGGANRLNGGGGADNLKGGGGADTFIFKAGQAEGDRVVDFDGKAGGDTLLFKGYGTADAGARFVKLDATHWQISSADGTLHETLRLASGVTVETSDYLFA